MRKTYPFLYATFLNDRCLSKAHCPFLHMTQHSYVWIESRFTFPIVKFPFINRNSPASPAYGVYISRLKRYSRACAQKWFSVYTTILWSSSRYGWPLWNINISNDWQWIFSFLTRFFSFLYHRQDFYTGVFGGVRIAHLFVFCVVFLFCASCPM